MRLERFCTDLTIDIPLPYCLLFFSFFFPSPHYLFLLYKNPGDLFAAKFCDQIHSVFPMKSTTHKPQNKEDLGSFSCMQKKVKRKKRFETMKKLLEIEETPWRIQFRPKQQRVVAKKPQQSRSCKRRMAVMHDLCGQVEVASSVLQRAEAVQANLDANFPSFVKPMIRSNVTKGFWLSLPGPFCKLYLPDHDIPIVLEDEDHKQYITKYLAQRRGLSAGWMGFSIAQKLVEGDILVFHMVKFNKLKVYIIRSSCLAEVDAALCLLQLDSPAKGKDSGHRCDDCRGLRTDGEKNTSSSQLIGENISGKSMPHKNIGLGPSSRFGTLAAGTFK